MSDLFCNVARFRLYRHRLLPNKYSFFRIVSTAKQPALGASSICELLISQMEIDEEWAQWYEEKAENANNDEQRQDLLRKAEESRRQSHSRPSAPAPPLRADSLETRQQEMDAARAARDIRADKLKEANAKKKQEEAAAAQE